MANILRKYAVYRANGSVTEFRADEYTAEQVEAWRLANWPDADPPVLEDEDLDTAQVSFTKAIINGVLAVYKYLFK